MFLSYITIDHLRGHIGTLPRFWKRAILISFDAVALAFCVWAAYSLRFGEFFSPDNAHLWAMLGAAVVAVPVFAHFGLYRSVIRYLPERAFWTIANAVVVATLLWVGVLFAMEMSRMGNVPRSVPAIYCILSILMVGGSRFLAKYLLWAPMRRKYSGQVLIYGAGTAGSQLASALATDANKYIVGFLDDDRSLQGRDVAGIRVYPPGQVTHLMETTGVGEVILSMPSIDTARRQQIVAELSRHQVKIRALPAIADLASGRYLISQIREIDIDDILGRSSVPADPELLSEMINQRALLVSGAGGSIGSELCKLIIKWNPRKLVLLEANEFALYQVERILRQRAPDLHIIPILGSVANRQLVETNLKTHGVQVVFHAAAHKHVPLVEANVFEGVRNNVFGTKVIAETSLKSGVEDFVLISTDKAVRPTNVMGATKRWAELIVHDCANRCKQNRKGQKFSAVRFGNVLGSNGSVVPLFKEQIASGGPVTVTDEHMTRYFMSIHEAAELIVQAGALSQGGGIFILDMGEPVKIRDLAENMIRLAGLAVRDDANPRGDIAISVIGRRPGEKTHEELFYDPASVQTTSQPKIMSASYGENTTANIQVMLCHLESLIEEQDEVAVRKFLFEVVNELGENSPGEVIDLNRVRSL